MYLKTAGIEPCLCCNKNIDGMIIYDLYGSIQEDEGLYLSQIMCIIRQLSFIECLCVAQYFGFSLQGMWALNSI